MPTGKPLRTPLLTKIWGIAQTALVPAQPLTSTDVAAMFHVTTETVITWADTGKLPHFRTPGGHYRFHRVDVEKLVRPVRPDSEDASL